MKRTIADVKRQNAELGHFFFEADSLRFFRGRVGRTLYDGRYFVTSEQFVGSTGSAPRRFTVRVAHADGEIDTVGHFQQHATNADAVAAIKELTTQD